MREELSEAPERAIFLTAQNVSSAENNAESVLAQSGGARCSNTDSAERAPAHLGSENFAAIAKQILGKDAGLHLHYIAGYPERSCYHYARGDRKPSLDFGLAVIRSEQGEPFHTAAMAGCTAKWWIDLQRYAGIGRDVVAAVAKRD